MYLVQKLFGKSSRTNTVVAVNSDSDKREKHSKYRIEDCCDNKTTEHDKDVAVEINNAVIESINKYDVISSKIDDCIIKDIPINSLGHANGCANMFTSCADCSYVFIKLVTMSYVKYENIAGFRNMGPIDEFYLSRDNNAFKYTTDSVKRLIEHVKTDDHAINILQKAIADEKVSVPAKVKLSYIMSELGCEPNLYDMIESLPLCPELFNILQKVFVLSSELPSGLSIDDYSKFDNILLNKFTRLDVNSRNNMYNNCTRGNNISETHMVIIIGVLMITKQNKFISTVLYLTNKIDIISKTIIMLDNITVQAKFRKIDENYIEKIMESVVSILFHKNFSDKYIFGNILNELVYHRTLDSKIKSKTYTDIVKNLYDKNSVDTIKEAFYIISICTDTVFMKEVNRILHDHPVYKIFMDMLISLLEKNNISSDFKGYWHLLLTDYACDMILANKKINKDIDDYKSVPNMIETYNNITSSETSARLHGNFMLAIKNNKDQI